MSIFDKGNIGSVIKDALIIGFLLVIAVIVGVNRFFPKDTVDQETLDRLTKITNQMAALGEQISIATANQQKMNAQMALVLERRGTEREKLYNDMLARYGADDDSDGVQSQDNSKRSDDKGPSSSPASTSQRHGSQPTAAQRR